MLCQGADDTPEARRPGGDAAVSRLPAGCCTLGDPDPVVKFEECGFAVQRFPTATPSEISEMARCSTVFVPGDPARTGRVTFWRPDGSARTDAHAHQGPSSADSPRRTTGSRRPPVPAFGMQSRPVPVRDATTNLFRGFTAFSVAGKASPAFKENDGMHDTKCGQP